MEFFFKLALSAVVTVLIRWGVDLSGHWIAWWAAALIALMVVFGGFLLFDDDVEWFQ